MFQAGALPRVSDNPVAHAALLLSERSPSPNSQWAWEMNYQEKTKRDRPQCPLPALGLIPGLRLFSSEKKKVEEYSFFLTLSPENKKSLLPLQQQAINSHRFVTVTFPSSHLPRLIAGKLRSELRLFKQVSNRQRDEVPSPEGERSCTQSSRPPVTGWTQRTKSVLAQAKYPGASASEILHCGKCDPFQQLGADSVDSYP